MSPDIIKIIDLKTPLKIDSQFNNEMSIKDDKNHILKSRTVCRENDVFFVLSFLDDIELVTPAVFKNKFAIDFSVLPLSRNGIKDFRLIIIKLNSFFIVIKINTLTGYTVDFGQIKRNEVGILFKNSDKFKVTIEKYEHLEEFYKDNNVRLELPPINLSGLGIIYDFIKNQGNNIKFAELKSILNFDDIYLILKNWENNKNKFDFHKHLDEIEGFLHKIMINNINYIFHYDNTISVDLSDSFNVVRMRNGNVSAENKRAYIDFFSKEGESELFEIYNKIVDINSKGLYLDPVHLYFSNDEIFEKSVVKSAEGLNQYMNNVISGIGKINEIIRELKEKKKDRNISFFSNVLSRSLDAFIYIDFLPYDLLEGLYLAEEIYKQGFINYGFFISEKTLSLKNNLRSFIPLLFVSAVFIDIEILMDQIAVHESLKNHFINLLEDRAALRYSVDNALVDFKKEGRLPVILYKTKNKTTGFFIGKNIYCALAEPRVFDTIIILPAGKWYSLKDEIIIEGGKAFSYKGEKGFYHLFQKENTIALYGSKSTHGVSAKSFFIFPAKENSFKTQIVERLSDGEIEIHHNLSFKKNKNSIVINYTSKQKENIGRTFLFRCIIKEKTVDKIIVNNKKKIFKREQNSHFIEFSHINKENCINVEIVMEKGFEKN